MHTTISWGRLASLVVILPLSVTPHVLPGSLSSDTPDDKEEPQLLSGNSTQETIFSRLGLEKRDQFNTIQNNDADKSILDQAFQDMRELVEVVVNNPNPDALNRYFVPGPGVQRQVISVFETIRLMAQPGGYPAPPGGFDVDIGKTNLNEISLRRVSRGKGFTTLAESFEVDYTSTEPGLIKVYDFGWGALFRRLLRDINCNDIGPKVNYKMYFLGSVLLHETM